MIEIRNKLYQPVKIIVEGKEHILLKKEKKIFKNLKTPTGQMQSMQDSGFINIKQY